MKNFITSTLAVIIFSAMLTLSFAGCYILYNAFPTWFQYGLGLGSFWLLLTTGILNLWMKAKGSIKKDKLKRDYERFLRERPITKKQTK